VHEKKPDGTLKELHRPSGGTWGGTTVDNHFIALMTTLQRRHFGVKTGNHLSGYQVVIEWLSSGG